MRKDLLSLKLIPTYSCATMLGVLELTMSCGMARFRKTAFRHNLYGPPI